MQLLPRLRLRSRRCYLSSLYIVTGVIDVVPIIAPHSTSASATVAEEGSDRTALTPVLFAGVLTARLLVTYALAGLLCSPIRRRDLIDESLHQASLSRRLRTRLFEWSTSKAHLVPALRRLAFGMVTFASRRSLKLPLSHGPASCPALRKRTPIVPPDQCCR